MSFAKCRSCGSGNLFEKTGGPCTPDEVRGSLFCGAGFFFISLLLSFFAKKPVESESGDLYALCFQCPAGEQIFV